MYDFTKVSNLRLIIFSSFFWYLKKCTFFIFYCKKLDVDKKKINETKQNILGIFLRTNIIFLDKINKPHWSHLLQVWFTPKQFIHRR